ncbi:MAG: ABC transporter ATP-binding protein [Spirochaetales bacterium]|nr:ABC transporter ATP-binding protein [Spirochaetales bacterium]
MARHDGDDHVASVDLRSSFQRRGGRPRTFEKARDANKALRRLAAYLKPYSATLVVVVGLIFASSMFGLLGPYLMGTAIDRFIGAGRAQGLGFLALAMLGGYLGTSACSAAANWIMASVSQSALKTLRGDLFARMQDLPLSFFDANASGGLMSRLVNDIEAVNQAVSQNVTSLVAGTLSMIGILVAMFALNPLLALASLFVVPLMVGFTRFVAVFTRKGFRRLQADLGGLNAVAVETISGQRVLKAFRRQETAVAAFRERNRAVFESAVYANSFAMLLMPLMQVLGNFFVVVLSGFGAWLALRGMASVGTIATFIGYGHNFTSPLRLLANLYNSVQAALAGAERVFEVMDTPTEEADRTGAAMPVPLRGDVSIRSVDFSYVPDRPVIRDFSLEVKAGQTVALVGPTGAGKTTIISLLTRFHELDSGNILVDGIDIQDLPRNGLRSAMGLVLQDTFLFSGTVLENIRYGRLDATDDECVAAAKLADADHFIRQLPKGYATELSERAGNLSHGQRQLLAISRAILSDPSILILDEATSSVDTRTEARIQGSLLRLMEGRTSFVIAHRLSTIRDADLVVVIDGGRIVERGTHDELLAARGFYHRLYVSQFKGNEI